MSKKDLHIKDAVFSPPRKLSRRDWFAGMAMQGILANSKGLAKMIREGEKQGVDHLESVAGVSLTFADALIAELDNPSSPKES